MSRVPKQGRDPCPMAPGRTGISAPWPQERQGSVSYGCRNDRDQCPMAKGQDRDQYSYFHLARISVWMAPGREGIPYPTAGTGSVSPCPRAGQGSMSLQPHEGQGLISQFSPGQGRDQCLYGPSQGRDQCP